MEKITVELGRTSRVVLGRTRYIGTRTGCNASNIEDYEVEVAGLTVPGTWDGDARHNVTVEGTRELRRALRTVSLTSP